MITLPMLGGEGWLQDPKLIMSRLFVHMFLTDHSQSNIYQGKVTSLQHLVATHGDDVPALAAAVEAAIKQYYSHYFTSVEVDFNKVAVDETEKSVAQLAFDLSISGYRDGVKYDLSKIIQTDNSSGIVRFIQAFDQ